MGWRGVANGELLRLPAQEGFEAFISTDRGFAYEQNQKTLPLAVVVLGGNDNKLATLERLMPRLSAALDVLVPKTLVRVELTD